MTSLPKICPLCRQKNNPAFTHCFRCNTDLSQPSTEEQITAYYQKKSLPGGVIFFIILFILGLIWKFPGMFNYLDWNKFNWYDWLMLGTRISILVLILGLIFAKEWARKGIIIYETIMLILVCFIFSFGPVKNSVTYNEILQKIGEQQQVLVDQGERKPFTPQELEQELKNLMAKSRPFSISSAVLFNLIWIYYFSVPAKRYFYYKSLAAKNKADSAAPI